MYINSSLFNNMLFWLVGCWSRMFHFEKYKRPAVLQSLTGECSIVIDCGGNLFSDNIFDYNTQTKNKRNYEKN